MCKILQTKKEKNHRHQRQCKNVNRCKYIKSNDKKILRLVCTDSHSISTSKALLVLGEIKVCSTTALAASIASNKGDERRFTSHVFILVVFVKLPLETQTVFSHGISTTQHQGTDSP